MYKRLALLVLNERLPVGVRLHALEEHARQPSTYLVRIAQETRCAAIGLAAVDALAQFVLATRRDNEWLVAIAKSPRALVVVRLAALEELDPPELVECALHAQVATVGVHAIELIREAHRRDGDMALDGAEEVAKSAKLLPVRHFAKMRLPKRRDK